ncbi:hypothetical protein EGW08_010994 [Elysia chlorotica]|uniref:Uncharacterized protein n=1 Tax=Elysia chlorotica TaxID=188477 RepID=A0A3S1BDT4_ELYCH|nr:hypothetical protein EGW08_010994 [Elysia chlorotica]
MLEQQQQNQLNPQQQQPQLDHQRSSGETVQMASAIAAMYGISVEEVLQMIQTPTTSAATTATPTVVPAAPPSASPTITNPLLSSGGTQAFINSEASVSGPKANQIKPPAVANRTRSHLLTEKLQLAAQQWRNMFSRNTPKAQVPQTPTVPATAASPRATASANQVEKPSWSNNAAAATFGNFLNNQFMQNVAALDNSGMIPNLPNLTKNKTATGEVHGTSSGHTFNPSNILSKPAPTNQAPAFSSFAHFPQVHSSGFQFQNLNNGALNIPPKNQQQENASASIPNLPVAPGDGSISPIQTPGVSSEQATKPPFPKELGSLVSDIRQEKTTPPPESLPNPMENFLNLNQGGQATLTAHDLSANQVVHLADHLALLAVGPSASSESKATAFRTIYQRLLTEDAHKPIPYFLVAAHQQQQHQHLGQIEAAQQQEVPVLRTKRQVGPPLPSLSVEEEKRVTQWLTQVLASAGKPATDFISLYTNVYLNINQSGTTANFQPVGITLSPAGNNANMVVESPGVTASPDLLTAKKPSQAATARSPQALPSAFPFPLSPSPVPGSTNSDMAGNPASTMQEPSVMTSHANLVLPEYDQNLPKATRESLTQTVPINSNPKQTLYKQLARSIQQGLLNPAQHATQPQPTQPSYQRTQDKTSTSQVQIDTFQPQSPTGIPTSPLQPDAALGLQSQTQRNNLFSTGVMDTPSNKLPQRQTIFPTAPTNAEPSTRPQTPINFPTLPTLPQLATQTTVPKRVRTGDAPMNPIPQTSQLQTDGGSVAPSPLPSVETIRSFNATKFNSMLQRVQNHFIKDAQPTNQPVHPVAFHPQSEIPPGTKPEPDRSQLSRPVSNGTRVSQTVIGQITNEANPPNPTGVSLPQAQPSFMNHSLFVELHNIFLKNLKKRQEQQANPNPMTNIGTGTGFNQGFGQYNQGGFPRANPMAGFGAQVPAMGMTPSWAGSMANIGTTSPAMGHANPFFNMMGMSGQGGQGGQNVFPGAGYGMGGSSQAHFPGLSHGQHGAGGFLNPGVGDVVNAISHQQVHGGSAQTGGFPPTQSHIPQQQQHQQQHYHNEHQHQQQHQHHQQQQQQGTPTDTLAVTKPGSKISNGGTVSPPKSSMEQKISKLLKAFRKASRRGNPTKTSRRQKLHPKHSNHAHSQGAISQNTSLAMVAEQLLKSNITVPVRTGQSQDAVIRVDKLLATMIETILADVPPHQRERTRAKLGLQTPSAMTGSPTSTSSSASLPPTSVFNPSTEIVNLSLPNSPSDLANSNGNSQNLSSTASHHALSSISPTSYGGATAVTPPPFSNIYTSSHMSSDPSLDLTSGTMGGGGGGGGGLGDFSLMAGMVTHAISPSLSHTQDASTSSSSSTSPPSSSPSSPSVADVSQAYETVAKALNMSSPELRQLLEARALHNANQHQQQPPVQETPPPTPAAPPTTTPAPWVPPETPEPPEAPESGEGGMDPYMFANLAAMATNTGMAAMAMANDLGVPLFNPSFTPQFQNSLLNFLGYSAY